MDTHIMIPLPSGNVLFETFTDFGGERWVEAKSLQNAIPEARGKSWMAPYSFLLEKGTQEIAVALYKKATGEEIYVEYEHRKPLSEFILQYCYSVEGQGRGSKTWMSAPLFLAYAGWLSADVGVKISEAYINYGWLNDVPVEVKSKFLMDKAIESIEEEVIDELQKNGIAVTPVAVASRTEARLKGIGARRRLVATIQQLYPEGDWRAIRLIGQVSKAINYRLLGVRSETFHELVKLKAGSPRSYLSDDFLTAFLSVESKICAFIDHAIRMGETPCDSKVLSVARGLADKEHLSLFEYVPELKLAQSVRKYGNEKGEWVLFQDANRVIKAIHTPL